MSKRILSPVEGTAESMEVGGEASATTVLDAPPVSPPEESASAPANPAAEQEAPPPGPAKRKRNNPGKKMRASFRRKQQEARPDPAQQAGSFSTSQQQVQHHHQQRQQQQQHSRRGGLGDPPLSVLFEKYRDLQPGGACPIDLRTKVQSQERRRLEQEMRKRQADRRAASGKRKGGFAESRPDPRPASGQAGVRVSSPAPQQKLRRCQVVTQAVTKVVTKVITQLSGRCLFCNCHGDIVMFSFFLKPRHGYDISLH